MRTVTVRGYRITRIEKVLATTTIGRLVGWKLRPGTLADLFQANAGRVFLYLHDRKTHSGEGGPITHGRGRSACGRADILENSVSSHCKNLPGGE